MLFGRERGNNELPYWRQEHIFVIGGVFMCSCLSSQQTIGLQGFWQTKPTALFSSQLVSQDPVLVTVTLSHTTSIRHIWTQFFGWLECKSLPSSLSQAPPSKAHLFPFVVDSPEFRYDAIEFDNLCLQNNLQKLNSSCTTVLSYNDMSIPIAYYYKPTINLSHESCILYMTFIFSSSCLWSASLVVTGTN